MIAVRQSLRRLDLRGLVRAVGLIGHLIEESRQPTGRELWRRVDDEASAHMKGRFSDET